MSAAGDLPVIRTARFTLSTGAPDDAPAMAAYLTRNRRFHAPTAPPTPDEVYTAALWERRFVDHRREHDERRAARFLIRETAHPRGALVGVANLTNLVWGPFCAAYLGFSLDEAWQGRGAMYEALDALLPWAFETLGLHRVMANHLPENRRSAALLRRLGFVPEGYARDYLFIDGAWRDHVLTAKTSPRPVAP